VGQASKRLLKGKEGEAALFEVTRALILSLQEKRGERGSPRRSSRSGEGEVTPMHLGKISLSPRMAVWSRKNNFSNFEEIQK